MDQLEIRFSVIKSACSANNLRLYNKVVLWSCVSQFSKMFLDLTDMEANYKLLFPGQVLHQLWYPPSDDVSINTDTYRIS
jgi:hypothetical protein